MEHKKLKEYSCNNKALLTGQILYSLKKRYLEDQKNFERLMQLLNCLTDSYVLIPMKGKVLKKDKLKYQRGKLITNLKIDNLVKLEPETTKLKDGKQYLTIFIREDSASPEYLQNYTSIWLHMSDVLNLYKKLDNLDGILLDLIHEPITFGPKVVDTMEQMSDNKEKYLHTKKES